MVLVKETASILTLLIFVVTPSCVGVLKRRIRVQVVKLWSYTYAVNLLLLQVLVAMTLNLPLLHVL